MRFLPDGLWIPSPGAVTQSPGPQFQADQGGESVLRRAAGCPAPPHGLAQRARGRQHLLGGRCGEFVHPALHQGQGGLKLLKGLLLGGCPLRHEDSLRQGFLDAFRVAGVKVPRELLNA